MSPLVLNTYVEKLNTSSTVSFYILYLKLMNGKVRWLAVYDTCNTE